jgi:hypothetical protein
VLKTLLYPRGSLLVGLRAPLGLDSNSLKNR